MYRFVSSVNAVTLKRRYLGEYNVKLLQRKFERLMSLYPDIANALPAECNVKKLLTGNFKYLTKVYCAFTGVLSGMTTDDRAATLQAFVSGGFKYDSHKRDIARFLTDAANGFEIYNCVYCDLEDVRLFPHRGHMVRRFETEHVLDKGKCPLTALSLYNFVPSCGTCNSPALKGSNTIGDTESEISRLSPTAEGYDFADKVKFTVNMINPNASDLKPLSHMDDYEIAFQLTDNLYQKSITLFALESRYNQQTILSELLYWREKRRTNPDNIVQGFAVLKGVTFEEAFEEMFQLEQKRQNHTPMEKARRDLMMV